MIRYDSSNSSISLDKEGTGRRTSRWKWKIAQSVYVNKPISMAFVRLEYLT